MYSVFEGCVPLVEVLDVQVQTDPPDYPFGAMVSGFLTLQAAFFFHSDLDEDRGPWNRVLQVFPDSLEAETEIFKRTKFDSAVRYRLHYLVIWHERDPAPRVYGIMIGCQDNGRYYRLGWFEWVWYRRMGEEGRLRDGQPSVRELWTLFLSKLKTDVFTIY